MERNAHQYDFIERALYIRCEFDPVKIAVSSKESQILGIPAYERTANKSRLVWQQYNLSATRLAVGPRNKIDQIYSSIINPAPLKRCVVQAFNFFCPAPKVGESDCPSHVCMALMRPGMQFDYIHQNCNSCKPELSNHAADIQKIISTQAFPELGTR